MNKIFQTLAYYYNTPKDRENELGAFLTPQKQNYPEWFYNNMSNDLRHQYASAVLTKDKGPLTAKILGRINEIGTSEEDSQIEDSKRDLKANETGRNYALQHPNFTNEQLLNGLFQQYLQNSKF